jgi:hypothetical protein
MPHAEVEFLMLADRAEVLNGKLYVMGGAWDRLFLANLDQPVPIFVAFCAVVPYTETDDDHKLTITISDADGSAIAPALTVGFKTGRPPQLERGGSQRLPFAVEAVLKFPAYAAYAVKASIDGRPEADRGLTFYVKNPSQPPGT